MASRSARFITCRVLREPSPWTNSSSTCRWSWTVCRAVIPAATSNSANCFNSPDRLPRAHDHVGPQQLAVVGDQLGGQELDGRDLVRLAVSRLQSLQQRALLPQHAGRLVLLAQQPGLLAQRQPLVFADQLVPLHRPGDDPDQVPRGGGVDADVAVGPHFVAERGHLLLALHAQHDDRLVGPARPIALDQVQGVQLVGSRGLPARRRRRRRGAGPGRPPCLPPPPTPPARRCRRRRPRPANRRSAAAWQCIGPSCDGAGAAKRPFSAPPPGSFPRVDCDHQCHLLRESAGAVL